MRLDDFTTPQMWLELMVRRVKEIHPELTLENMHEKSETSYEMLLAGANMAMLVGADMMDFEDQPKWATINPNAQTKEGRAYIKRCREYPYLGMKVLYDLAVTLKGEIWKTRDVMRKQWAASEEDSPEDVMHRTNLLFLELVYDTLSWLGTGASALASNLVEEKAEKDKMIANLRAIADTLHTVGLQLRSALMGMQKDGRVQLSDAMVRSQET